MNKAGYTLNGFKRGGMDDQGYSYCTMLLKDNSNRFIEVEYPEKDPLYFSGDFLPLEDAVFVSCSSDLFKLLKAISKDELGKYIEEASI